MKAIDVFKKHNKQLLDDLNRIADAPYIRKCVPSTPSSDKRFEYTLSTKTNIVDTWKKYGWSPIEQ